MLHLHICHGVFCRPYDPEEHAASASLHTRLAGLSCLAGKEKTLRTSLHSRNQEFPEGKSEISVEISLDPSLNFISPRKAVPVE